MIIYNCWKNSLWMFTSAGLLFLSLTNSIGPFGTLSVDAVYSIPLFLRSPVPRIKVGLLTGNSKRRWYIFAATDVDFLGTVHMTLFIEETQEGTFITHISSASSCKRRQGGKVLQYIGILMRKMTELKSAENKWFLESLTPYNKFDRIRLLIWNQFCGISYQFGISQCNNLSKNVWKNINKANKY